MEIEAQSKDRFPNHFSEFPGSCGLGRNPHEPDINSGCGGQWGLVPLPVFKTGGRPVGLR